MHILLGLALGVAMLYLVVTNDDARYLLGQMGKIVFGLGATVVLLGVMVVVVLATRH